MFRFTIRDVLWLMVVVGMAVGWWDANQRALDRENAYKLWAVDIAIKHLEEKTGEKLTVTKDGIWIVSKDGTAESFRLPVEAK